MNVEVKLTGVDTIVKALEPKIYDKAMRRTLREIGRGFRTLTVKDVRKTYNVKAKELKSRITAKTIVTSDGLAWKFEVKGRTINLIHFGARQLKRGGVSFLVRRDHGRQKLRSAFIARGSNGALRVFMRKGKARLPIEAKNTLSVAQMFNDDIVDKNLQTVRDKWPSRLRHNIDYYLGDL